MPESQQPHLPLPPKPVDLDVIENAVSELLRGLGQGDKNEVMSQTPRRVAELYAQSLNPGDIDIEEDFKVFDNPGMQDLILVNDVHYVSLCEHHLAPAFGVAHIGYVPGRKVAGYSKLKKGLNYLARQPQLNERLVVEAVNFLQARLQPKGIAMVLRSAHCCMALRTNAPSQEVVTVIDRRGALCEERYWSPLWASAFAEKPAFLGR
ncbi:MULTISPECIES: GTP cyclohydrolase I [unclassified Streptomyces]|uniref:GTP cyclohydrolase I n=1 Tax=unclassified Streptomyces TaxID=2593676 RepID=UPI0021C8D8CF|nr:GTP cyclohydrolase I [Streptomyces sp. FIT100]UUN30071.1 GTP cyclohydrolase I [Streptomyces sp. FIT100]